jgi:hypothetical protein
MKKIIFTLSIISIVLVSCQEEKKLFLTEYFDKIQECELKEITGYPYDSIGNPRDIFSHEDYIILSEPQLKYLLSSYNMATQSFTRFLPKGQGPDEFLYVQQIRQYKDDSLFCVKDVFTNEVFVYAFNDNMSVLIRDEVPDMLMGSFFYDNNKLIGTRTGKQKRCFLYDMENKSNLDFGEDIIIENCSPSLFTQVLTGHCVGNTELKRVAWTAFEGDVFEIYDYTDTENIKTITSVKGVLPVVSYPDQAILSAITKLGVSSITASNKYIYLLYNENRIEDSSTKRMDILLCNKILVYDWNGNPQKILKTSILIKNISYNSKYNRIYCIGYDDDNGKIYYIDDLD